MTFSRKLAEAQQSVEARLDELLTSHDAPPRLLAAMRHAVLGGGKRLRPFLVLETAGLFGARHQALDVAAALECVHCYSLVHDDLPAMDNDRLRRGKPTVWAAFDEWTAVLAGDALLTLAFEILANAPIEADAVRCRLIGGMARAAGPVGMVGGQCLDLMADKLNLPQSPTLEHVRSLQDMKTGALIRFACEAGAVVGKASASEIAALQAYGRDLGFAFQIADDLLDATGDEAAVGKAVAKDAAAGKATLVSLMGIEAARARLSEVVQRTIEALEPFGARAATLREATAFVAHRTS